VKGVDPETGFNYDDTKRYIDNIDWVSRADKEKIFRGNVEKVYPRFKTKGRKR
jgi:4-oxalmesaconate hydratase